MKKVILSMPGPKSPASFGSRITDFISQRVRFFFNDCQAHEVFLAGSFNNWNPGATPLTNIGTGRWALDLRLPPGHHEYQFVVDGHWRPDRRAHELVINPFGELNSVLIVPRAQHKTRGADSEIKKTPPKWRGPYRALVALREDLLRKRGELLENSREPVVTHGANFAESATEELDHELDLAQLSTIQETLYEVEQALRRIQQGTYGKCETTGKPIDRERLRAIPWTRFSSAIEADLEATGSISHLRLGELRTTYAAPRREIEAKEEVNDED